jgi:hypothetical protein
VRSALLPFATREWVDALPLLVFGAEEILSTLPSGATLLAAVQDGLVAPPELPELLHLRLQAPAPVATVPAAGPFDVQDFAVSPASARPLVATLGGLPPSLFPAYEDARLQYQTSRSVVVGEFQRLRFQETRLDDARRAVLELEQAVIDAEAGFRRAREHYVIVRGRFRSYPVSEVSSSKWDKLPFPGPFDYGDGTEGDRRVSEEHHRQAHEPPTYAPARSYSCSRSAESSSFTVGDEKSDADGEELVVGEDDDGWSWEAVEGQE